MHRLIRLPLIMYNYCRGYLLTLARTPTWCTFSSWLLGLPLLLLPVLHMFVACPTLPKVSPFPTVLRAPTVWAPWSSMVINGHQMVIRLIKCLNHGHGGLRTRAGPPTPRSRPRLRRAILDSSNMGAFFGKGLVSASAPLVVGRDLRASTCLYVF